MRKLAPAIKKKISHKPEQTSKLEGVLPIALKALKDNLSDDVRIHEVFVSLEFEGKRVNYDYFGEE